MFTLEEVIWKPKCVHTFGRLAVPYFSKEKERFAICLPVCLAVRNVQWVHDWHVHDHCVLAAYGR